MDASLSCVSSVAIDDRPGIRGFVHQSACACAYTYVCACVCLCVCACVYIGRECAGKHQKLRDGGKKNIKQTTKTGKEKLQTKKQNSNRTKIKQKQNKLKLKQNTNKPQGQTCTYNCTIARQHDERKERYRHRQMRRIVPLVPVRSSSAGRDRPSEPRLALRRCSRCRAPG